MSLPRRAMQEMGLAICCLLCDAPDEAGSARCRACIGAHERARERISRDRGGPIEQLGRDLLAYSSEPDRHDHHEIHGPMMREYGRLLTGHAGERPPPTQDEVEALFEEAREKVQRNALRDAANQNPWSDVPPEPADAREMLRRLPNDVERHEGARTVPSRAIEQVDRSDRSGEDRSVSDRVRARASAQDFPEELREPVEEMLVEESTGRRQRLDELLGDVGDLIDE